MNQIIRQEESRSHVKSQNPSYFNCLIIKTTPISTRNYQLQHLD